jgi:ankyrin repeat protein
MRHTQKDFYNQFIHTIHSNDLNGLKNLINIGIDITIVDNYGLKYAASQGYLEIVKLLVENGANIHAEMDYALRFSARNGYFEVVKYLVENWADIHAETNYALRWSALNGHLETVKYLVENGADIHAETNYALLWSIQRGHLDIVNYFIIDCNMTIKEETLQYLQDKKYEDILNIINTRDLNNSLVNDITQQPTLNLKIKKLL